MIQPAHIAATAAERSAAVARMAAAVSAARLRAMPMSAPPETTTSSQVVLQRDFLQVTPSPTPTFPQAEVTIDAEGGVRIYVPSGSLTTPTISWQYARLQDLTDSQAAQDFIFGLLLGAKLDNSFPSARLAGRYSAGTGTFEAISVGSGLSLSGGGVLSATGGGGGGSLTAVTVTAPYPSVEYTETVTDAACTPSSKVTVGWGNPTEDDENSPMMDSMQFLARPGSGSFTVSLASSDGSKFGGPFKLHYSIS